MIPLRRGTGAEPAPLGLRWAAGLIDLVLLSAAGNLLGLTVLEVAEAWTGGTAALALAGTAVLAAAAAYFAAGEGYWGTTLGKLALGLRVVEARGQCPGWRRALVRFLARMAGTVLAGAGWWPALGIGQRPAGPPWHDTVARTRVVRWRPWQVGAESAGR
ncbi:putative membrane protein [Thermaerobacter subterraneus DSM 13965]|uniref:Membrane protein n=1 Tax=Thermaerobacter subterraneus DSM 13965 TaxID=867903 RepID=K6P0U7_9FIRM|nr:putative membrane protein [Thermaerobacter subterraneus DSM 13965]